MPEINPWLDINQLVHVGQLVGRPDQWQNFLHQITGNPVRVPQLWDSHGFGARTVKDKVILFHTGAPETFMCSHEEWAAFATLAAEGRFSVANLRAKAEA